LAIDRLAEFVDHNVDVVAVDVPVRHRIAAGALGQVFFGAGALDLRAHRHAVVFHDVDDWDLIEACEVQRFVECALINRSVAHEAEGDAAGVFVFLREGSTEAKRNLSPNNAMAAEVSHGGLKQMHRSTLAFGAAGYFSEKLRHRRMRRHAEGEAVAVASIAINQVIPFLVEDRRATDGDGFLATI
jgi:hypothetical protein